MTAKRPGVAEKKILREAIRILDDALAGDATLRLEIARLQRHVDLLREKLDEANRTIHERNLTIGKLRK